MTWLAIFHEAFYGKGTTDTHGRDLFYLLFERVYFELTLFVPILSLRTPRTPLYRVL